MDDDFGMNQRPAEQSTEQLPHPPIPPQPAPSPRRPPQRRSLPDFGEPEPARARHAVPGAVEVGVKVRAAATPRRGPSGAEPVRQVSRQQVTGPTSRASAAAWASGLIRRLLPRVRPVLENDTVLAILGIILVGVLIAVICTFGPRVGATVCALTHGSSCTAAPTAPASSDSAGTPTITAIASATGASAATPTATATTTPVPVPTATDPNTEGTGSPTPTVPPHQAALKGVIVVTADGTFSCPNSSACVTISWQGGPSWASCGRFAFALAAGQSQSVACLLSVSTPNSIAANAFQGACYGCGANRNSDLTWTNPQPFQPLFSG